MRNALANHEVSTAYEPGWATLKNGELLAAAEEFKFEVFITTDKNLRYQQNLVSRSISIIVLSSTSWSKDQQRQDEQYQSQLYNYELGMFDFEKSMRNDRESFDTIRALSPTRFRFRVVDAQGRDIRTKCYSSETYSTRVECGEPGI